MFLYERKRFDEALPKLREVVALDPISRMGLLYLARCHHALGQRDESQALMTRYREVQRAKDLNDDAEVLSRIADQLTASPIDGRAAPDGGKSGENR